MFRRDEIIKITVPTLAFLFVLLCSAALLPGTAFAAPACGSGGPLLPGSFFIQIFAGPGSLAVTASSDVSPISVYVDPGSNSEILVHEFVSCYPPEFCTSLKGFIPALAEGSHLVAFVAEGYAPRCFSYVSPPPIPDCDVHITSVQVEPTHGLAGSTFTVSGTYEGYTTGGTFGWVSSGDLKILGNLTAYGGSFSGSGVVPYNADYNGDHIAIILNCSDGEVTEPFFFEIGPPLPNPPPDPDNGSVGDDAYPDVDVSGTISTVESTVSRRQLPRPGEPEVAVQSITSLPRTGIRASDLLLGLMSGLFGVLGYGHHLTTRRKSNN